MLHGLVALTLKKENTMDHETWQAQQELLMAAEERQKQYDEEEEDREKAGLNK